MTDRERDLLYVAHIEERAGRVGEIAAKGRDAFMASHILQDAVIRNFEVIGEAAKQLSEEFKSHYPEVPWQRVAGFRDILIHNYMGVDLDEVWNVIEQSLPELVSTVQRARRRLEGDGV